ncbi:SH3 domain-containing protein [Micromonospora sp. CPCC 205539]|uniref:SH3 domain-containing protein n=1 Tax=Micromonospora sp. CPCC 205539 TaxID=3122408 RepID=UPI002FF3AEB2
MAQRMIARALVLVAVMAGLTLVGQAAPASAAPCGVTAADTDQSPYGQNFLQNVSLRTGPDWTCKVTGTATYNNLVDYHCYVNVNNVKWVYLRTATTKYGWVWADFLVEDGSYQPCDGW